MLAALGCVTLVALALIAFAYSQQRSHREAQAQWALERRELLERIQRPERLPAAIVERPFEIPDVKQESLARVGDIDWIDDSYGVGEDG